MTFLPLRSLVSLSDGLVAFLIALPFASHLYLTVAPSVAPGTAFRVLPTFGVPVILTLPSTGTATGAPCSTSTVADRQVLAGVRNASPRDEAMPKWIVRLGCRSMVPTVIASSCPTQRWRGEVDRVRWS